MKQYSLDSREEPESFGARRFKPIGKITFTFDKVFQNRWDKYPKFIRKEMFVFIYENETTEKAIEDVKRNYKNAKDFKVEINK